MRLRDIVLALLVTACWGVNFVFMDVALREFPPLFLATLRFFFTAVPAVLIVRRPPVPFGALVAIGLSLGVGQFGLLFLALHLGMPAGLASIVVQAQALFTLLFGAAWLRERVAARGIAGTLIALIGLIAIGASSSGEVPLVALILTVGSAACWGVGNVATRQAGAPPGLGLLVWSSLVASPFLMALSFLFDGGSAIWHGLTARRLDSLASVFFIVVLASLFGYGVWFSLLRRYATALVAPISLLVPVTGLATAWIALGERPGAGELLGSLVVIAGLGLLYVPLPRLPPARVA